MYVSFTWWPQTPGGSAAGRRLVSASNLKERASNLEEQASHLEEQASHLGLHLPRVVDWWEPEAVRLGGTRRRGRCLALQRAPVLVRSAGSDHRGGRHRSRVHAQKLLLAAPCSGPERRAFAATSTTTITTAATTLTGRRRSHGAAEPQRSEVAEGTGAADARVVRHLF